MKCFHCNANHHLKDCPKIDNAKKEEIMAAKRKHWAKRKATTAAEKSNTSTILGQAHCQTSINKVKGIEEHQDDKNNINLAFMPNEEAKNNMVK